MIDEAAALYGRLDVAFANAGIDPGPGFVAFPDGSGQPRAADGVLERYSDERWNPVIEINLNGILATARAAARHMRPRRSGRITITTSVAATVVQTVVEQVLDSHPSVVESAVVGMPMSAGGGARRLRDAAEGRRRRGRAYRIRPGAAGPVQGTQALPVR